MVDEATTTKLTNETTQMLTTPCRSVVVLPGRPTEGGGPPRIAKYITFTIVNVEVRAENLQGSLS